jgi:hypothetical protein
MYRFLETKSWMQLCAAYLRQFNVLHMAPLNSTAMHHLLCWHRHAHHYDIAPSDLEPLQLHSNTKITF